MSGTNRQKIMTIRQINTKAGRRIDRQSLQYNKTTIIQYKMTRFRVKTFMLNDLNKCYSKFFEIYKKKILYKAILFHIKTKIINWWIPWWASDALSEWLSEGNKLIEEFCPKNNAYMLFLCFNLYFSLYRSLRLSFSFQDKMLSSSYYILLLNT